MKADIDYCENYCQNQAEVKYGIDFDELKDEIKDELWNEAQADFYEAKVGEAEALADSCMKEPSEAEIEAFLEIQAEADREIKNGWVD